MSGTKDLRLPLLFSRSVVSHTCDPMDCSPPGSSVHGILQARILEWVAHFLLQGTFLTQGSNPSLLHWQADSLPLSHPRWPLGPLKGPRYLILFNVIQGCKATHVTSFPNKWVQKYDFFPLRPHSQQGDRARM